MMIEAIVPSVIAVISGVFVLTNRIHGRIGELDRRIDGIELRVAQDYVSKADFQHALERVENQLIRLEEKLDVIAKIASDRN